jgi:glycosyltransferase involved in cell wall biosynthesis
MERRELPFVSIVTPVYNGEHYLDECIQSVRSQSYQNWEYIILNNCSTDKTPEIIEKHSDVDSRIRVVNTTELLPLIRNHNYALQQISADSQYCKMVHADDMLMPNCVDLMVAAAQAHPTAGIVGSYGLWGKKVVSDGIPLSTTFISGRELSRLSLLDKLFCFWSPSALLVRSDFIRKRKNFYNGEHLHADDEACYEILEESDFAFVHQVLTFIRKHDESATETITASYNKIILSNLDLYLKYGPVFLAADEYEKHLKFRLNRYYGFLVNSLFDLREKEFWRYHKKTCQEIGLSFSLLKLARAALSQVIGRPAPTVMKIGKTIKKRLYT